MIFILVSLFIHFFFNDTATTEIYTLSLHDALPILKCNWTIRKRLPRCKMRLKKRLLAFSRRLHASNRSEERFSRNAETDLVCRLLLEKKKINNQYVSRPICLLLNSSMRLPFYN